ncbi:MAG TPA: polymer-forming cytoskeletal protein [Anaerolineales bacterium]|nr:polymer-forming cytoskeletal protein [Anaerolineales bacterium]
MFRRKDETPQEGVDRVDSVIGAGLALKGTLTGTGGVRIEGAYEGDVELHGLVVVGEQGRVTCRHLRAETVVVAGSVRGDITAQRVEIHRTGRVWGNVVTASFSTEEGAFLRGQITMEERIELPPESGAQEAASSGE